MTNNPEQGLTEVSASSFFEEVGEDSTLLQKMQIEQSVNVPTDLDDFIFRTVKTSAGKNFIFFHLDEEGKETNVIDNDRVFAFRGVPLKFRFGFSLYDTEAESGLCKTTGVVLPDGHKVDSSHPMSRPIYSPALIGDKAPANTPRNEVIQMNPIGSRGKSCSECVRAGEHMNVVEKDGGKDTTSYCGLQSSVIMFVYQVGLINPQIRNSVPYDGIEWVDAKDVKTQYGVNMFDGPFILNMRLPRKAATTSLSSRGFQAIIDPFNAIPAGVRTTSQLIRAIYDEGLVRPMKIGGNDELMYNICTEVYAGRPAESCAKAFERTNAVPLWNICNNNEQLFSSPDVLMQTIQNAWMAYVSAKDSKPKSTKEVAAAPEAAKVAPAAPAPAVQTPVADVTPSQAAPVQTPPVETGTVEVATVAEVVTDPVAHSAQSPALDTAVEQSQLSKVFE